MPPLSIQDRSLIMNLEQAALYQRLQDFSLDQPDASLSFSRRLARDNHWSLGYAHRVIEEYKKFAFLAVVAGHPVTPSDQVDQVWHLHLLYTRSYWEVFCPQVLQTPLHHGPTQGGKQEQHKFTDWYEQTLSSYEQIFGVPPADIWPPSQIRFGRDIHFVRVNTQQNWMIPKFEFPVLSKPFSKHLSNALPHRNLILLPLVLTVLLGLTGCNREAIQSTPLFTESLPDFALSYFLIGTAGFLGALAVTGVGKLFNRNTQLLSPLLTLLALLLFGLTLLRVGLDVAKPTGPAFIGFYLLAFFSGALFSACRQFWQPSVSREQAKQISEPFPLSWQEFVVSIDWTSTQVTRWAGFVSLGSWLGMTTLCGLGIARIFIGLSRERPVGYLTVICLILGVYILSVVRHNLKLEYGFPGLLVRICRFLVILSLVITLPGSLYFLWMTLNGAIIWIIFGGLMLIGMVSNQTTSRRGTSRSSGSYSVGNFGGDSSGDGGGDGGGDGCGGCGGCGG